MLCCLVRDAKVRNAFWEFGRLRLDNGIQKKFYDYGRNSTIRHTSQEVEQSEIRHEKFQHLQIELRNFFIPKELKWRETQEIAGQILYYDLLLLRSCSSYWWSVRIAYLLIYVDNRTSLYLAWGSYFGQHIGGIVGFNLFGS